MRYNEKAEKLFEGLSGIREDYLMDMDKTDARPRIKHKLAVTLMAAALAVALLTVGVAAAGGGSIAGWFEVAWRELTGQEMGEGQRALVQSLSQTIGLSQTVNGVTVTVDSAAAGDSGFTVLLRVDGVGVTPLGDAGAADEFYFKDNRCEIVDYFSGLHSWWQHYLGEEDGSLLFLESCNTTSEIFSEESGTVKVKLGLGDLMHNDTTYPIVTSREEMERGDDPEPVISTAAEGEWSFTFELDLSEAYQSRSLGDAEIESEDGTASLFSEIVITSTGLRYRVDVNGVDPMISAVLADGTEIGVAEGMGLVNGEDNTSEIHFRWSLPVNLDDVVSVRIGETEIPVK